MGSVDEVMGKERNERTKTKERRQTQEDKQEEERRIASIYFIL